MALRFLFLTRVFEKEVHAEDFLHGKVRIAPLLGYRKIESDPRSDEMEGVFDSRQISGIEVTLRAPNGASVRLGAGDRMIMHPNWVRRFYALCTTVSLYDPDWVVPEKHFDEVLDRYIRVPEDSMRFGDYGVIVTDPPAFILRVRAAAGRADLRTKYGLVTYGRSPAPPQGMHDVGLVFRKRRQFRYEREYRFAFESSRDADGPLFLDVGDLRDIAQVCRPRELNRDLTVTCGEADPSKAIEGPAASWKDDL